MPTCKASMMDSFQGYTNADNPFGDEHLLDTFVWGKKLEKEGKKSLEKEQLEKMQKEKMEENRVTLCMYIGFIRFGANIEINNYCSNCRRCYFSL